MKNPEKTDFFSTLSTSLVFAAALWFATAAAEAKNCIDITKPAYLKSDESKDNVYTLHMTMRNNDQQSYSAHINDQLVKEGDKINDMTVAKITHHHVLLIKGRNRCDLWLDKDGKKKRKC